MKKLLKIPVLLFGLMLIVSSCGNETKSESKSSDELSSSSSNSSSSSSDKGLETSKKAYKQGYSDGQTGYGLAASSTASAYEYYSAYGYNYSKEDYNVYVMGYNDGLYGRTKQY